MSFKPNPGCAMPEVQLPPSLSNFFADVQKKILAAKAAAALANVSSFTKGLAVQLDQDKQVNKLKDQATKRAADIAKYEKIVKKYASLQGNCPLPDVIDKKATGITS